MFLYNSFFNEEITFNISAAEFYSKINVNFDNEFDAFFVNSKKYLIINIFNILLPLCALLFVTKPNFKLSSFINMSLKVCDIFLYSLILLILIKFFLYTAEYAEYKNIKELLIIFGDPQKFFFNVHGLIVILDFYFLFTINKIFSEKEPNNKWDSIKIFLIISCIVMMNSSLHLLVCAFTFAIYYCYYKKKFKYFVYILVAIMTIVALIFLKDYYIDQNNINDHGSVMNSILKRIANVTYFFIHSENLNYITGNNIFSDNIYTYPHNMFVDILICTGVVGLSIFLFFMSKLFLLIKNRINSDNLLLVCLLFQSFLISSLTGFFFSNIATFAIIMISFMFFKEKDRIINPTSLG